MTYGLVWRIRTQIYLIKKGSHVQIRTNGEIIYVCILWRFFTRSSYGLRRENRKENFHTITLIYLSFMMTGKEYFPVFIHFSM